MSVLLSSWTSNKSGVEIVYTFWIVVQESDNINWYTPGDKPGWSCCPCTNPLSAKSTPLTDHSYE